MPLILVGGGSRSGKSSFALNLARGKGSRLAFVATAEVLDEEIKERVANHQRQRESNFVTVEEAFDIAGAIGRGQEFDAIVVDCLTLWVSNHLLTEREVPTEELIRTIRAAECTVILVTNEVGCGIVPENALARRFRDLAGSVNQVMATAADEVYWMVFGVPLKVK